MSASAIIAAPRARQRIKSEPVTEVKRVALLGCGTVGSEVARALIEHSTCGGDGAPRLTSILVREPSRDRGLPAELFTNRFQDILDEQPDLVVELLGGVEPAARFIRAALERGISVVTANKCVMARHGRELSAIARARGAVLACEACVGGAVPILGALRQFAGDRVRSIKAVLNGTCNFVLDRMGAARISLDEALAQAISLGFAEPDASADIDGHDARDKLCVLAAAVGFPCVTPQNVEVRGIRCATLNDIDAARSLGRTIKLIAELVTSGEDLRLRVTPALLPRRHTLAEADGATNVFAIESELAGSLVLHGQGAGPKPTTSAIMGDVLRIARGDGASTLEFHHSHRSIAWRTPPAERFYIGIDGPAPALDPAQLFGLLGECGIDSPHVEFRHGHTAIITGPTEPSQIESICARLTAAGAGPPLIAPIVD